MKKGYSTHFGIRFKLSNKVLWRSPGRIYFYKDHFEIRFLWKKQCNVQYEQVTYVKKTRYILDQCTVVYTNDLVISMIPALFKRKKMVEYFKSLGFSIET